jgi:SAM-dependent methyltransferase
VSELELLAVCPVCHADLVWSAEVRCDACPRAYEIVDGIPLLVAPRRAATNGQNHFFDEEVEEEFEITRPHGLPALYGWLLCEKFRRSVAGFGELLPGTTALAVCAGSGMDAEFLARSGACVIAADLSLGAARRAHQRADRFGVPITPLVADAERLPVRDRSVDVVYVHDGLHHLADPLVGLAEMARVASLGVSVTEPARAAITRLAIRVGIAGEFEEAGNRVERVTVDKLRAELRERGFEVVHAERYGMFYRHAPKRPMHFFSRPGLLRLSQAAFLLGNRVAGGLGNKLSVQAVRAEVAR